VPRGASLTPTASKVFTPAWARTCLVQISGIVEQGLDRFERRQDFDQAGQVIIKRAGYHAPATLTQLQQLGISPLRADARAHIQPRPVARPGSYQLPDRAVC